MAQLTARFWVDAYLTRLRLQDIPAFVVTHGDDTAGSVLVKINTLNGSSTLYQRRYDLLQDSRTWEPTLTDAEAEIDAAIARQRGFDPDLWVIEIEDRAGRHLLDTPGLA